MHTARTLAGHRPDTLGLLWLDNLRLQGTSNSVVLALKSVSFIMIPV